MILYNNHTMLMVSHNTGNQLHPIKKHIKKAFRFSFHASWIVCILIALVLIYFEQTYKGKVYPNVWVGDVHFGGKTKQDIESYWLKQNIPFSDTRFIFQFEDHVATVSGTDLAAGYDATLSATQAYLVGRSGHVGTDFVHKFIQSRIVLDPYFRYKTDVLLESLKQLGESIDIPVQEALFRFQDQKVTAFRPSKSGRRMNIQKTITSFETILNEIPSQQTTTFVINIPVDAIEPTITTERANSFGIKERIGLGYSEFSGSIPGRIHNVVLAANKLNGILIKPDDTFSFIDAIGDISATTGFQQAYVIKNGRTVLGDGGGVCQVSTTLFRAALNAGLPIVERKAHAYRVHYYEEGGFKPGLDATVFAPSVDLKIKNDTPAYILIQTKTDIDNLTLTFELYGTSDGRKAEITNHKVWGVTSPPPDLYQDDPTLPPGKIKQVDWAAWGAKASFDYRVTRNDEVLQNTSFFSSFRPWQAVYLRGVSL